MAVRLHDRVDRFGEVRREVGRASGEQFRERDRLLAQPLGPRAVPEQLAQIGTQHRGAGRFQAEHRHPGLHKGFQDVDGVPQDPARDAQLPGADPGQSTTDGPVRYHDREPGRLQRADRGGRDARRERHRERVREQQHAAAVARPPRAPAQPPVEPGRREPGHRPSRVDPGQPLGHAEPPGRVRQVRRQRREPRPQRQPAQRVVVARPQPPGVVVRQELRLVRGHVHVHRAVALAALAHQAQVQRVGDLGAAPAVGDRLAAQHLEQQPGPAPRRMLLLAGHLVARAHHRAAGLGAAALPHAGTAQRGAGEGTLVVAEREERVRLGRCVGRSEAQVLVQRPGVDDLPRVHPVVRVEDGLELTEGLYHVVAVHLRQQLAAGLAVAVLAGQRSAVGHHEVGRLLHEPPVLPHPVGGDQVERDAAVHAAVAEVAVDARGAVPEPVQQLGQVAQVRAQVLRADRGVLPTRPGVRTVRRARGGTQPRLAHLLQLLPPLVVVDQPGVVVGQFVDEPPRHVPRLVDRVATELDHQPGTGVRQQGQRLGVAPLLVLVPDQLGVQGFQLDRPVRVDGRYRVAGRRDVRVPQQRHRAPLRLGQQPQFGAQHGDARRLGADQGPRDVEPVVVQQFRQLVPGDAPRDVREPRPQLRVVPRPQVAQPPVDVGPPAAAREDRLDVRRRTDPHPRAVVGQDLQAPHVRRRGAAPLRGRAARVVAHHPADRAVAVGGRARPEDQAAVPPRLRVHVVEHRAGLHDRGARVGVDRLDRVHVLRPVQHDRNVAARAAEAGTAAPGQYRHRVLPAHRNGFDGIVDVARYHHADRHLAVVGAVGGVRRPGTGVEPHLAAHPPAEVLPQGIHYAFSCSIRSLNSVVAIAALCGWPCRNASANFLACS